VESDSDQAPRILDLVRRLELPLALLFNRGRVMVLPQAISKATGLREALKILRLSPHNAVAIGDAENDYELLQSCEAGLAVAWGSEFLKQSAITLSPAKDLQRSVTTSFKRLRTAAEFLSRQSSSHFDAGAHR